MIEIALIRPGPIQGGAVHPYIRRATGREEVTYLHPALEPVLERTKGVPLFQEQLMQIAMAVGGCTGDDADLLRRAMGSKRGVEKIERLKDKLYAGMASNGITGELADDIYSRIQAFANFGFAESHAISFALLVYASSWLKLHYPGAFLAGLLRAQPMGFYSPQSLVADARRHGVAILRPDIMQSEVDADLNRSIPSAGGPTGLDSCLQRVQLEVGPFVRSAPDRTLEHRRDGNFAVRLGLTEVQGIGRELAERIVLERRKADVHRYQRRGTPGRAYRAAGRSPGHCWSLRLLRTVPSAGALECRIRRQRPNPAGLGHRRHPARAAGDERGGADSGRLLGHADFPG